MDSVIDISVVRTILNSNRNKTSASGSSPEAVYFIVVFVVVSATMVPS